MQYQSLRKGSTKVGPVFLAIVAGLATSGCGTDTGGRFPLAGEVTLSGTPLDKGTIEFHGNGASGFAAGQVTDGRFEIPAERGVLPGSYLVRIYSENESEMADPVTDSGEPPGPEAGRHVARERIPPRYNNETQLEVRVENKGDLDLRFDLQS